MKFFMRSLGRQEQIGKYMELLVCVFALYPICGIIFFLVPVEYHYSHTTLMTESQSDL